MIETKHEGNLHGVFKVKTQKSIFLFIERKNGLNLLAGFRIPNPDEGVEEFLENPLQRLKSIIKDGGKMENLNGNEKEVLLDLFVAYQEEIFKNLRAEREKNQQKKKKPNMQIVHVNHKKVHAHKHWHKHSHKAVG